MTGEIQHPDPMESALKTQAEATRKLDGKIEHDPATCWWCQRAAEIEKEAG